MDDGMVTKNVKKIERSVRDLLQIPQESQKVFCSNCFVPC
jgi:hypothetical protein